MYKMHSTNAEYNFKLFWQNNIHYCYNHILWYEFFFNTNQVYTGHLTPHMYMYNVIDQQTYTNNAPKSKAISTLLHVLPI